MNRLKEYRIEDLGTIVTGKTPMSSIQGAYSNSGIPFVTPKDMDGRMWIGSTERYLTAAGVEAVKNCVVPENSVSVSCIGSDMGKAVLLEKKSVTNQQINTIIVNQERFDPIFVYYLLSTQQEALKAIAGGSATPILNKGHFGKFTIFIPEKNVQKSISETLKCLDDKIRANKRINKTLEAIAQAIFRSWFVDFDPVHAKVNALKNGGGEDEARLAAMHAISGKSTEELAALKDSDPEAYTSIATTADAFPSAFNESPLGIIPCGWVVDTIIKFSDTLLGGTPSRAKPEYWGGDIPWIGSGKVNEFRILEPSECITKKGFNSSSTKLLPKRTTVIAITGATLGQVSLLEIPCCANQSVVGIVGKKIPNEYIYLWIKKNIGELVSKQTGGAQQHINKNDVNELKILFPGQDLLRVFIDKVTPYFDMISTLAFEVLDLSKTRDTLLPKLLSGEIEIKTEDNVISIEDILKKALNSCQSKGYVDIEQLCHEEGIAIVSEKMMTNSKAELRYEARSFTVYVANKKDHYSIAHELGHYVLTEHRRKIEEHGKAARKGEASLSKLEEQEAENLAAEILMPEEFIHHLFDDKSPDEATIKKYARQLRVSEQALRYRLNSLGYQTSFKDYRKGYQGTV